jgi:predicted RNA-binding Zn ribbon-like protein
MTELQGAPEPADAALPLLGESVALDAVNSRYGVEPDVVDFLDEQWVDRWIEGLDAAHRLGVGAIGRDDVRRLRAVRDAARTIVLAALDGARPARRAVDVLNEEARRAPTVPLLRWTSTGPTRDPQPTGTPGAPLPARLAIATIELVTGPDVERVRRCARPGCSMLFIQDHGHRRFCHPSCSHVMRQARYRHLHPDRPHG